MTEHRDNRDPNRAVTVQQAFDQLGAYYYEQLGDGDTEADWARLYKAMVNIDPTSNRATRLLARCKRAVTGVVRSRVVATTFRFVERAVVKTMVVVSALVTFASMIAFSANYWWPIPASLLFYSLMRLRWRERDNIRAAKQQEADQRAVERRAILWETALREAEQRIEETRVSVPVHATVPPQADELRRTADTEAVAPPATLVELEGADLTATNLRSFNLIGANLAATNLENCNLREANMYGANLTRAVLFSTDLSRAELTGANLTFATLDYALLSGARLVGANLSNARLTGADISSASLSGADLCTADLSGAILSGADLSSADLSWAILRGAYLSGAHMHGANLADTDLSNANLRRAFLYRANLLRANLSRTNLTNVILTHAVLVDADLSDAELTAVADLQDVLWSERTKWGKYREEVLHNSVPLGKGRYRLNPPDGTTKDTPIMPAVPVP